jgi:hypothetical protein
MKNHLAGYLGLILLALLSVCGQKEEETIQTTPEPAPPPYYADTLMPPSITTYDIVRVGDVGTVKPETATDYLGSSAVAYRAYRFVGMSSGNYTVAGVTVSAEIAQFPTADDAYGFFARLQPFGVQLGMLGSESFEAGNTLYFAAGEYVVTLSIDESTLKATNARSRLALEINSRIAQKPKPMYFLLFPSASKIGASNRYYPDGFLEGVGLEQVYTTSYAIKNDTTLFFLMIDEGGTQYSKLSEYASDVGTIVDMPDAFNFIDFSVAFEHPRHGMIVAGLVRKKLVGIIDYHPKPYEKLATGWIRGLQM